jgi:succinoglycan biosynthesis protein ExoV
MLLHHWRPPPDAAAVVTNFGDELNLVLWPKLLGDTFFDDDGGVVFLGIGSLLGWPKAGDAEMRHRIVFGSGAMSADAIEREPLDPRWHVYCVRGPSTAEAYGLDSELAVTDPAVLVADFYAQREQTHRFGYMPHLVEARQWSALLSGACTDMGVRYIDPRDDVESVIESIGSVGTMVAEAMHGAIVADALRVPWIPVYTTRRPHRYKWTDWCRSIDIEYEPRWIGNASSWGARCGVRGRLLDRASVSAFASRFRRVTERCAPQLSAERVHVERLERLHGTLALLQSDVSSGRFADE